MREGRRGRLLAQRALNCSAAACALLCASAAPGQRSDASKPGGETDDRNGEIVIVGIRGSAVTDIAPITELGREAIEATGASTMAELLQALRGTTQSADGADPIFLLNAQRVSGYQEIGSLPPEAIEKIEILPEPAALRFGFPPTRRVVNFITKRRFRQVEAKASAGSTTRWGSATEKADLGITRLRDDSRLSLNLEYRRTDPLYQSDRRILPDPDIPFDAVGNVTGLVGGEIDPALSALAGQAVTIAPVPDAPPDRNTLAGFAAGANRPRLFDVGPYATLAPRNDMLKVDAVIADRIGGRLAGSLSLSAEQSRDRGLGGPGSAKLIVPDTNPFSPFAGPVLLNRYLTEVDPLRQRATTTTLHAGATLRGAVAGWQWDLTASLDQKQVDSHSELGIDPTAADAAIAAGADPFAPLDPALLTARLIDRTRQRTRTAETKAVVTNTPIRLPAGRIAITASLEAAQSSTASSSRGSDPFDLQLSRGRIEGSIAVDVPLTSRRARALPFVGDLSVSASANLRHVSGFGPLHDTTYGAAWTPFNGLQLLATVKKSAAAPDMMERSIPGFRAPNVPVFDFGTGGTDLVTVIRSGNPDLLAEHRLVQSLALNVKPFAKRELRLSATYEATRIRNQVGTVSAVMPKTEAILPDLFTRDATGRLVMVTYRPINFYLERQRSLRLTLNASGRLGKTPPQSASGARAAAPPPQASYYAGIGPTIKFEDGLQLRPDTPTLDLLAGDSIGTWTPRAFGYAYGGISYQGYGATFNGWYGAGRRVRGAVPAADLRFLSLFKLNIGGYLPLHSLLQREDWTRKLQLRLDVENITDARQQVRDGNGTVPYRYQAAYQDPLGRTVTITLRKLF
ncbi:MAG: hypothetical protein JWO81_2934 [Alphaproteobacteria bacterium]|nr:hypothetical protein [Alphaproteobacteria bacterium]